MRVRLGKLQVVGSVQISSFRGHWLIRAIAELLNLEKVRVPRALRSVQAGAYFSIKQVRRLGRVRIYQRSLAGQPIDYCAVFGNESYHANTVREAIAGLRLRLAVRAWRAQR